MRLLSEKCPFCSLPAMLIWSKPSFQLYQFPTKTADAKHSFIMDLNLYFCEQCHHAFIYPLPDSSVMTKFYSDNYGSYTSPLQSKGLTSETDNPACNFIAKIIKSRFKKLVKITDVGGYDGYILHKLSHLADELLLIEGSKSGVAIAKKHGIPVLDRFLDRRVAQTLAGKFDIVISREVIEHLADPLSFLRNLSLLLKEGGLLFIETPDLASVLKNLFIRSITLQHFHEFSLKSINKLLNLCGLCPVQYFFPTRISFMVCAAKKDLSHQRVKKLNYRERERERD